MKTGQGTRPASLGRRSLADRVARARVPRLAAVALLVAAAFLMLSALATPAAAAKRVALVIGNGAYQHAPVLPNPPHDAEDVAAALKRNGFQVTRVDNASQAELFGSLQKFSVAASASEVAVVFYAGHGLEVDGQNYLVPVDAHLQTHWDLGAQAVPMEWLSRALDGAQVLKLIILDACRDNPFVDRMKGAGTTRSINRGLARIENLGHTLVAYAAAEGQTADDGGGRNSPYTTALLQYIEEPGLEVGPMFRKVTGAVVAATGGTSAALHLRLDRGGASVSRGEGRRNARETGTAASSRS